MKLQPIDHPVLGHLVPNQSNDGWICFRQIPSLAGFAPDSARQQLGMLSHEDRQLVHSWQNQPEKLVRRCREFAIFDSLRGLGVYELDFGNTPSEEQAATWKYFQEHEAQICTNIGNTMLRYYQSERAREPDWFDQWDCPEVQTVAELWPLATLDGVSFSNPSCEGLSVMRLSWKVDWDVEHGLSMLVWRDQVIGINLETLSDILFPESLEYHVWNSSNMTPLELEYQERVRQALWSQRQGEDFAGEFSDTDERD